MIEDQEHLGGRLYADKTAYISDKADIDISADVVVGEGTAICREAMIITHEHNLLDRSIIMPMPLDIGRRCFIGARAIILPQVRCIGDEAAVGAGSVVTKDIPAGEVWAGNPAHFIRYNT